MDTKKFLEKNRKKDKKSKLGMPSATDKIKSKRVFKQNKMIVTLKQREPYSVLGERNTFFNGTYEQDKRNFFLQ